MGSVLELELELFIDLELFMSKLGGIGFGIACLGIGIGHFGIGIAHLGIGIDHTKCVIS